jgi:Tfp pilus assembly protein PilX
MTTQQRHRGFLTLEIVIGMVLLTALALALTITLTTQKRLNARLADHRRALHAAESALLAMQSRQPFTPPEGTTLSTTSPDHPSPSAHWVRITATVNRDSADLVGLVPNSTQGAHP